MNDSIGGLVYHNFKGGARRIYVCCRNIAQAELAVKNINILHPEQLSIVELNLNCIQSIGRCAKFILDKEKDNSIDILVCNAGELDLLNFGLNPNGAG